MSSRVVLRLVLIDAAVALLVVAELRALAVSTAKSWREV